MVHTHPPQQFACQMDTQRETKIKIDKDDDVMRINLNKLPQEGIINVNVLYRLVEELKWD